MARWLLPLLLLPLVLMGQDEDPLSRRGVQYAAQGTDFWVCFPRTLRGMSPNFSRLYVVSERDCDVTITNENLDVSQTFHVIGRRLSRAENNYSQLNILYTRIIDTVPYQYIIMGDYPPYPHEPQVDYTGVPGDLPQPRGFHVTSTDTISLFVFICGNKESACSILPTEMLRDEYIAQPPIVNHHIGNDVAETIHFPGIPDFLSHMSSIDIVATEDSTVVDIIPTDWDWLNRPPGDTLTVTLRRGQLFHLSAGEPPEKYYPDLAIYYRFNTGINAPWVNSVPMVRHSFLGDTVSRDTFAVDLAGTRIKARDCKRIAVFESSGTGGTGIRGEYHHGFKMEQSVPTFFAGQEYLVPNVGKYMRFTALDEETHVTIRDASTALGPSHTLTIAPGHTDWWETDGDEGPYYITSDHPVIAKRMGTDITTLVPTRWWHWGQVNHGPINDVDPDENIRFLPSDLHIFARTADIHSFYMDYRQIYSYFTPVEGTPYSYAHFGPSSNFCTGGAHHILNRARSPFLAYMSSPSSYFVALPHVQPGGTRLMVNGQPADSLTADTLWCVHDPVEFQATNRRPCDSLLWDFGDGTTAAFGHDDEGFQQPLQHTFYQTGIVTVRAVFKYQYEGCLTRKPDTLSITLDVRGDVDTSLSIFLCEGSYTFRNHELEQTGQYEITTSWPSGSCDTLWRIDFVTCPHCRYVYDTVSTDDMPVTYNDITFSTEQHDTPIRFHIGDTCDSIIYYTLIAIPYWGERPIDSTWVIAPNVFTPNSEPNNRFALRCSRHILQAEVTVFDRRGVRVAQFDGLTGHWDGTVKSGKGDSPTGGTPAPQGTYVYYIRYMDTHDAAYKTLTGTVTLIR
ncbi:MAG: gliding motility-associated C-terminal domain-containing protein [Bacteroidales bacterium]|nr:gliding motility-associated C-terminal domain-containing protein [Bacteroidales bacterium]